MIQFKFPISGKTRTEHVGAIVDNTHLWRTH